MSVRNPLPLVLLLGSLSFACGGAPTQADGVVTVTQTTSTTTTTPIPALTASGVVGSPSGIGLASSTLFSFSLAAPPTGGVPPYTVSWEFGDGSAPAAGNAVTHQFLDPGFFTPTATIRDSSDKSVVVKTSSPLEIATVSGHWDVKFGVVPLADQSIDLVQSQGLVTAAINATAFGTGVGTGSVTNPRTMSLSVTFADALPSAVVATFVGDLDEGIVTWTGKVNGYPDGRTRTFVAKRQ